MKIILNGQEVSGIDGARQLKIVARRKDEENKLSKSVTGEVTLFNEAFEIIRQELIDNPAGKFNFVTVKIYDDCCDDALRFEGIIRGDGLDWCPGECSVKCQIIEDNEETRKIDCIKSKLIWDNTNGFLTQNHPRVTYCIELRPSAFQDVIYIFGILLNIVYVLLSPVLETVFQIVSTLNILIFVINVIIDAVNLIPGVNISNIPIIDFDGNYDTNLAEEWWNLLQSMNELIIGCGRKHPSPLVRKYIQNVCDICGIGFESSIFTDQDSDYYNTVYLNAPVEKGTRNDFIPWIAANHPIKTLEGLLSDLKPVFAADYRIENGVLRFEREDFFWQSEPIYDYEQLLIDELVVNKICFSYRADDTPAFGRFEYSGDPVDWVGNEALPRNNDIVEFNDPYSQLQKGSREVLLPFGVARFRGDGIDRDVLGDYSWWPGWSNLVQGYENVLIMNNGTNFQPKLLIWDGVDLQNAKIKRFSIPGQDIPADENFNYPYFFNEDSCAPNTGYPSDAPNGSLYKRFHAWQHPKLQQDNGLEFNFTFKFNCNDWNILDLYSTVRIKVRGQWVNGRIDSVEINPFSRTMQIQGKV